MENDDFTAGVNPCTCAVPDHGLCGPHDRLEVVRRDGVDIVRRAGCDPCPDHLAAIRRAREFSGLAVEIELGEREDVIAEVAERRRAA